VLIDNHAIILRKLSQPNGTRNAEIVDQFPCRTLSVSKTFLHPPPSKKIKIKHLAANYTVAVMYIHIDGALTFSSKRSYLDPITNCSAVLTKYLVVTLS